MRAVPALWERVGIEIEYMICNSTDLSVASKVPQLFKFFSGSANGDLERGAVTWSNELASHVVELKTTRPAASLRGWAGRFQREVATINGWLKTRGLLLVPTAMHPFMDPARETVLWPHGASDIYRTFDRIFDCRGHGWSNLQSVHLNLSFSSNAEFARLHAAVRILIPLLPALAASSPYVDGRVSSCMDTRLKYYRRNAARIPAVSGKVVPEPAVSRSDYEHKILEPIAKAIAPYDKDRVLDPEWTNARGAIARFSRGSLEIRVLDVQECPAADLAVAEIVLGVLKSMIEGRTSFVKQANSYPTDKLSDLMIKTIRYGERAQLLDQDYLNLLGIRCCGRLSAARAWAELCSGCALSKQARRWLEVYLTEGTLARRLLRRSGGSNSRKGLLRLYRDVGACLGRGVLFIP